MKKNLCVLMAMVMAVMPFITACETTHEYKEMRVDFGPAQILFGQQLVGNPWYGGAIQGGIFLLQELPRQYLVELIKEKWGETTGKCPDPAQIYKVEKGWRDIERALQEKGLRMPYVQCVGYFGFKLGAPAVEILAALIKGVAFAGGMIGAAAVLTPARISAVAQANQQANPTMAGGNVAPITVQQQQQQLQQQQMQQTQQQQQ